MNKNELKKVLKPLIKQCIKEVLFEEEGALSHIISEVANGLNGNTRTVVTESAHQQVKTLEREHKKSNQLKEQRKKLLDAIGKDAYGGVNVFEGTTPAPPASNSASQGSLSGVDPRDPGVDISDLFSNKSAAIYNKMMGKK
jgi:hypothetical protein